MSEELWALEQLARARHLQDWMFAELRASELGPMLEIGVGIRMFSHLLLVADAAPLVLVEPEPARVEGLEWACSDDNRVDIAPELLPEAPSLRSRLGSFRYALAQNVLEHIEADTATVAAIVESLASGGELPVLVPAHQRRYSRLGREFGHVRRYMGTRLGQLVAEALVRAWRPVEDALHPPLGLSLVARAQKP
jgi:hypothetical protein